MVDLNTVFKKTAKGLELIPKGDNEYSGDISHYIDNHVPIVNSDDVKEFLGIDDEQLTELLVWVGGLERYQIIPADSYADEDEIEPKDFIPVEVVSINRASHVFPAVGGGKYMISAKLVNRMYMQMYCQNS